MGSRALDILGVLVERPGDLLIRAEIIAAVWPGMAVEDSNLDVQIAALRRVVDEGRTEQSCIQTAAIALPHRWRESPRRRVRAWQFRRAACLRCRISRRWR